MNMHILNNIATRDEGMYSRNIGDDPNKFSQTIFQTTVLQVMLKETYRSTGSSTTEQNQTRKFWSASPSCNNLTYKATEFIQLTFCLGYLSYLMSSLLVSQEQRPDYLIFSHTKFEMGPENNILIFSPSISEVNILKWNVPWMAYAPSWAAMLTGQGSRPWRASCFTCKKNWYLKEKWEKEINNLWCCSDLKLQALTSKRKPNHP